jgi:hypothetical protein
VPDRSLWPPLRYASGFSRMEQDETGGCDQPWDARQEPRLSAPEKRGSRRVSNPPRMRFDGSPLVASRLWLGSNVVWDVLVVIGADHLHDIVLLPLGSERHGPWFDKIDRIIICDGPGEGIRSGFLEHFRNMEFIAMLMASGIEPASIADPDGVHDELVAFVVADRIAMGIVLQGSTDVHLGRTGQGTR